MTAPVTLDDVKDYLNIPLTSTKNDTELQDFIDAAVIMAEEMAGPIVTGPVTELHDGGSQQIVLSKFPVSSVTSVTDTLRSVTYTTDPSTPPYYVLEDGILTLMSACWPGWGVRGWSLMPRFGGGTKNIQVVYVAGRDTVSAKMVKLLEEIVKHLWRTQQGSRMTQGSEEWAATMSAMTDRVWELLGEDERAPRVG